MGSCPTFSRFLAWAFSKCYLTGTSTTSKLVSTAPSPVPPIHTLGTQGEWENTQCVPPAVCRSSATLRRDSLWESRSPPRGPHTDSIPEQWALCLPSVCSISQSVRHWVCLCCRCAPPRDRSATLPSFLERSFWIPHYSLNDPF